MGLEDLRGSYVIDYFLGYLECFLMVWKMSYDNFFCISIILTTRVIEHRCKKKDENVVFMKTHKTGSSTITSIFNRFADINQLEIALPGTYFYSILDFQIN